MSEIADLVEIVLRLRPDWRAGELASFEYLPGGYSNRNYRFRHRDSDFALRVPERERAFVDRELEHDFYQSLPADLRVPEIEAFDPGTGAMISRWQSGALLCDVPVEPARVVLHIEALHAALVPCPRVYDPVAAARQQLATGRAPGEIVALAHRLCWAPSETTACHNDLNPWNLIQDEGGEWVTLDWEWLGMNDPVFDLVVLHQGLGLEDDLLFDLARELLGPEAPDMRERVRDCILAFWLREYGWAHEEVEHHNDRPEILDQLRVSAAKLSELAGLAVR